MKKFIIFLLCVAVVGGGSWFGYKKYMSSKQKSTVVDVVPVELMMTPAEWFSYDYNSNEGEIVASNSQKVYIDTEKLVKTVFVEEGQEVKKGDPILEYDMTVVELELKQKENEVKTIEHDIKMAEKELENIKRYKPSEDAPQEAETDMPDLDDIFGGFDFLGDDELPEGYEFPGGFTDYGDLSEFGFTDDKPIHPVSDIIKPNTEPAEGKGTLESPYIINCTQDAEVSKEFMLKIHSEKKCAEICVYSEDLQYLYKWILVPEKGTKVTDLDSWKVSDGITVDKQGNASIDPSVKLYGKLSFTQPTSENSMTPDEFIPDELTTDAETTDGEDITSSNSRWNRQDDSDDLFDSLSSDPFNSDDPENFDYVYTRDAIKKMVTDKENEIKMMQLELKSAKFELETSKKRKTDGKLYAEIDGFVKKIGKASGDEDTEEEEENIPDEEDEDYLHEDPSEDDNAFAVIQGEGGTEVTCVVNEMSLSNLEIGATVTLRSWNTGAIGSAEITKIDDTPISYQNTSWGQNPNNSMFVVHAKLFEGIDDFNINEWVEVTIPDASVSSSSNSNSVYLPIHYVRQEGGDYYIMKADEDGKLKKQYVKVGQTLYSMIEIKGGLKSSDKICFPFGKDVREGVKTRETTEVLQPEGADIFY